MAPPTLIPEFEPLLKAARPTVYQTNAFRMAGLAVDAPAMEIGRQLQTLEMRLKLSLSDQAPSGLLPLPSQPSLAALQDAKQRLGNPQTRLIEEFFWFWPEEPGGSKSDLAFQALQRRDLQSATDIWLNRSRKPTDTCSIHNLAVLHHLQALETALAASGKGAVSEGLWIQAWKYWRTLVDHDPFWKRLANRICELEDPRLTSAAAGQIRSSLLSAILLQVDLPLAVSAAEAGDFARAGVHLKVARESGLPAEVLREQTERSLAHVRTWVTQLCASAEAETSANVDQTAQILNRLLHEARPKLELLNFLLGAGNRLRDAVHDQAAKTVRDSLIAFGNKTEDWKACEELLTAIQSVAASQSIKTQIADDLAVVRRLRESSTCWFCKENRPDEKTGAVVEMYGDVTRTPTSNGTNFQWRHAPVKVPRCRQCRTIHVGRKAVVAAAAGLVAALIAWGSHEPGVAAFLATVAAWLGTVLARHIGWFGKIRAANGARLRVLREMAKRDHPIIADLKSQLWAFGKRPSDAPTQISGATIGKSAAWVGLFAFLAWVFSALADPSSSTSTTIRSATPPAARQPSTPSVSGTTARTNTPATRQGGNRPIDVSGVIRPNTFDHARNSYIELLQQEIKANKVQLATLSAAFEQCQQALAYYKDRISQDRQRLDQIESDSRPGLYVDETEYETIRMRHNSNVRLHNKELESCRATAEQHDALVDSTNAKTREYNRLIGAK